MLQEYGAQRPHVFQILTWVHNLRGTKSRFTYTIPTPTPLSPRSLNVPDFQPNIRNGLEGLVTYSSVTPATPPKKSPGVQAREKVLEAIAPLRRGRAASTASHQSVPSQEKVAGEPQGIKWPDNADFEREKEMAWTATRQRIPDLKLKEQLAPGATDVANSQKAKEAKARLGEDDPWSLRTDSLKLGKNDLTTQVSPPGLASNLSLQKSRGGSTPPALVTNPGINLIALMPQTSISKPSESTRVAPPIIKVKDAFEGLGLSLPEKQAPLTLSEARKLRTGLAATSGTNFSPANSPRLSGSSTPRGVASLRPGRRSPGVITSEDKTAPEARFPSLEELDASFTPPNATGLPSSPGKPSPPQSHLQVPLFDKSSSLLLPLHRSHLTGGLRPHAPTMPAQNNGTRSQQVTGVAMRGSSKNGLGKLSLDSPVIDSVSALENDDKHRLTKPSLPRSQRSSVSGKPVVHTTVELLGQSFYRDPPGGFPDQTANAQDVNQQKDLLTGSEDERSRPSTPSPGPPYRAILRDSPGKRVAVELPQALIQSPKEAVSQQAGPEPSPSKRPGPSPSNNLLMDSEAKVNDREKSAEVKRPTTVRVENDSKDYSSSEDDEGPEDVFGYGPSVRASKTDRNRRGKGRQSSVHELVDLWAGKDKETGWLHTTASNNVVSPKKKEPTPIPKPLSMLPRSSSPDKLASSQAVNQSPKRAHHRKGSRGTTTTTTTTTTSSPTRDARPQSMFVFPVHKSEEASPSPTTSSAFQPPSQLKSRRLRKSSISNMVQRYEAMDEQAKGKVAPTVPPKSPGLKLDTPTTPAHENGPIPTTRRPSSPVTPRKKAHIPSARDGVTIELSDKRLIPSGLPVTTNTLSLEKSSSLAPSDSSSTSFSNKSSPEERPPSPEKPYQGVTKLIDEWQRKTAAAESSNAPPLRRGRFINKVG
jgi:AP2-associated kinase